MAIFPVARPVDDEVIMYRIVAAVGDASACSYYRTILPSIHCGSLLQGTDIHITNWSPPAELPLPWEEYDCFWFSRSYRNRYILQFVLRLFDEGKKIIWDLDDDLPSIPMLSPAKSAFGKPALSEVEMCLRASSAITVSTANLKAATAEHYPKLDPDRIHVLENLIDLRWYERCRTPVGAGQRPGPIRVIWTGSSSHVIDLEPFHKLYEKYRYDDRFLFLTYGHRMDQYGQEAGDRLVHIAWNDKKSYEPTLSLLSPSISLVPLSDCPFNLCKSAIKYFESTAAGAAVIASDISPYSDVIFQDVTGLLVNEDGWEEALEDLASHPWKLTQLQKNASISVYNAFSWHANNGRRRAWVDFFRGIPDIEPVNPVGLPAATHEPVLAG